MIKIILGLLLALLVLGCRREIDYPEVRIVPERFCTTEDRPLLVDFIQTCIKNANNMSDEEMEDVVQQCERTGFNTVCPIRTILQEKNCYNCYWRTVGPSKDTTQTKGVPEDG